MNKILVIILLLFSFPVALIAQESPLCGDWTGNYYLKVGSMGANMKRFIRIKKYGDNYTVRMKEINLDLNRTTYSDCVVTSSDDNSISFYEDYPKEYENDDSKWVASEGKNYWSVQLVDGVLKLRNHGNYTKLFDKNNNTKEINMPPQTSSNMNLYKDDSDW